jgi:riboflavin synthase
MFTGLVEATGILRRRGKRPVARAVIETRLGETEPLVLGESVSVDGACLTVDRILPNGFEADLSSETLDKTTLGLLPLGATVHLERATKLGGRMGGHTVLGHVDGFGEIVAKVPSGDAIRMVVRAPGELARFLAPKGSVALNGVSLTINDVTDAASSVTFGVMLVPHTLGRTALGEKAPGARLNVEVDVLARYVARTLVSTAAPEERRREQAAGGRGRGESEQSRGDDERLLQKLRSGGWA